MGQALYRTYRSKKLSEIIGQEHITDTLTQALKQDKISHAYLFTGPRGVGKTSIARILAHEINKLPYTDDSMHMDIIEIDAASNRRIDEIRELRDKVHIAPTSAKYKAYIIDEVHMLTREAFNALLKTLEEPPAHAVFILATTDAHKLPDTIVSRTQRFNFKPVATQAVVKHLRFIADQENIAISDDALEALAQHGEGSFRDSISLLDQASGITDEIQLSTVQSLLGIPSDEAILTIITLLGGGQSAELAGHLEMLYGQGLQATVIAKQLNAQLRESLLDGVTSLPLAILFDLMETLLEVPLAHNPNRYLEIILLKALSPNVTVNATQPQPAVEATKPIQEVPSKTKVTPPETKLEQIAKSTPVKVAAAALDETLWPQVLQALKQKHNTLYGVVRMAQPSFTNDAVVLSFQFAFHQKRISEASNRKVLMSVLEELTGKNITVDCVFDKNTNAPVLSVTATPAPQNASVAAISNIFGGGELLES